MGRLSSLVLAFASAACFHPDPSPGAPCGPNDVCPTGLSCVDGVCGGSGGSGGSDGGGSNTECTDQPNGTSCYDCASGAASCASCAQGACLDSMCTPSGAPRPALLESPLNANNQDEGSMFDVVAAQAITITSFDGHLTATGNTDYEIWTRPGTYVGFADSSAGWTKVGMATFVGAGGGAFSPIPIPINVTIQAGQRQAFYLTNKTANNRYHNGTQVGAPVVSNAELTIYEGAGVNYGTNGFAGTNTARVWEGKIHYTSGGGTTLATAMAGAASSDGIMFDVKPTRDLELSLLSVNFGAGTHDVDVYFRRGSFAGNETSPAQWRKLASVAGVDAADTPTVVSSSLGLFLEAGATTALYVTTTTGADVRSQAVTGASAATNADVTIGHGVTVSGSFGGATGSAMPNVELGYGTCN